MADSQMTAATRDESLTDLAQAYQNQMFIYDQVFPVVSVDKQNYKIPRFRKEHFQLGQTERALRAESNTLDWQYGDPITGSLKEHDKQFPYDHIEGEDAEIVSLENYGVDITSMAINLRIEDTVAGLVTDPTNYTSNNVNHITAPDSKWNKKTSDPFADFSLARETVTGNCAADPNVVVFGVQSWYAFKDHPAVLDRLKYSMLAVLDEATAAKLLNVDRVIVGKAIKVDGSNVPSRVWSDMALMAYIPNVAPGQRNIYQPTFGFTLRHKGYPYVDKGTAAGGKVNLVRTTDRLALTFCGSDSGYLIYDTL